MGAKTRAIVTVEQSAEWGRQRGRGMSNREIAQAAGVDEGTVRYWTTGKGGRRADAAPPPAPRVAPAAPPAAPPVPPSPPRAPPPPLEDAELGPDELRRELSDRIRIARAAADQAIQDGDAAEAKAQNKLIAIFAGHLRQIHSKADEDSDVVRVRGGDIQAAADRALSGLTTLADRVIAEVQAWPACAHCGRHVGTFADADRSPLRALMERVARA